MFRLDDASVLVTPHRWMAWDTTAYNAALVEHGIRFDHADQWFQAAWRHG